jgi:hypothetical protein
MVLTKQEHKQKSGVYIQKNRLERYYYQPPHGSRFWVLEPYVYEHETALQRQVRRDLSIDVFRPMEKAD